MIRLSATRERCCWQGLLVAMSIVSLTNTYAQNLPGLIIGTRSTPVTVAAANNYFATIPDAQTYWWTSLGRPPEIKAMARALRCAPETIFSYVRNNIEIVPLYGVTKGALGALIDQSGTAFDQAHLMVELLRECGFTTNYKYGSLTLNTTAKISDWLGVSDATALRELLASGGIPATVTPSTGVATSLTVAHVWVEVVQGPTSSIYDPAYKPHTFVTGMNLGSAMATAYQAGARTYNSCQSVDTCNFLSAGSTSGALNGSTSGTTPAPYISNINVNNIKQSMIDYSMNVYTAIKSAGPETTLDAVIGGQKITPLGQPPFTGSVGTLSEIATWGTNIPDEHRTKVRIQIGALDATIYQDEFYGRRLRIVEATTAFTQGLQNINLRGNHTYRLKLLVGSRQFGQAPTTYTTDSVDAITVTIDHPYVDSATVATYMDEVVTRDPPALFKYYSYPNSNVPIDSSPKRFVSIYLNVLTGPVGRDYQQLLARETMIDALRKSTPQLGETTAFPNSGFHDWDFLYGQGIHAEAFGTFPAKLGQAIRLIEGVNKSAVLLHHAIVLQAGALDVHTAVSAVSKTNVPVDRTATLHTLSATTNVLEAAAISLTAYGNGNAATPSSLFLANNTAGQKFWGLKTRNQWTTLTGSPSTNLPGYTTGTASRVAKVTEFVNGYLPQSTSNSSLLIVTQKGDLQPVGAVFGLGPVLGQPNVWSGAALVGVNSAGTALTQGISFRSNLSTFIGEVSINPIEPETFVKGGASGTLTIGPFVPKEPKPDRFAKPYDVDVYTGRVQLKPPPDVVDGVGEFPYKLSYQRIYDSSKLGPVFSPQGLVPGGPYLGAGWKDNIHWEAVAGSDFGKLLGQDSPLDAATSIATLYVLSDIYKGNKTLARIVPTILATDWWRAQSYANVLTIERGLSTDQFVRRPDWTATNNTAFTPRSGVVSTLKEINNGGPGWAPTWPLAPVPGSNNQLLQRYELTTKNRVVEVYDMDIALNSGGTGSGDSAFSGVPITSVVYPYGVTVTWDYGDVPIVPGSSIRSVLRIRNSLGRAINVSSLANLCASLTAVVCDSTGFGIKSLTTVGEPTPYLLGIYCNLVSLSDCPRVAGGAAQLTTVVDALDKTTKYRYGFDSASPPTYDDTTRHSYDFRLSDIFVPSAPTQPYVHFNYDEAGRIKSLVDANGNSWDYFISHYATEQQSRSEVMDPPTNGQRGSTVSFYNDRGKVIQTLDPLNRQTDYTYFAMSQLPKSKSVPGGQQAIYAYDNRFNLTTTTRKGSTLGGAAALPDLVTTHSYHATCNVLESSTDARNFVTNYTINPTTCLIDSMTQPTVLNADNNQSQQPVWQYQYDRGLLKKVTDPTGRVTDAVYNATTGFVDQVIVDPGVGKLNLTTVFASNAVGDITFVTDPRGKNTRFEYDNLRQLKAVAKQYGADNNYARTEFDFTDNGQLWKTRQKDPAGAWLTTEFQYTPTGQLWKTIDPEGHVVTNNYDQNDRLDATVADISLTPLMQRTTKFFYDFAGQKSEEYRGWGTADQIRYGRWVYTLNGKVDFFEDGIKSATAGTRDLGVGGVPTPGSQTDNTYDAHDRVDKMIMAGAASGTPNAADYEQYTYDANSNVTGKRTRSNHVVAMVYDALNRETQRTTPANTAYAAVRTLDSKYDLAGRARVQTAEGQSISSDYDAAGRLDLVTDNYGGNNYVVDHTYDASGNRTGMTWPGGGSLTYGFDDLNRMVSVIDNNGGVTLASFGLDNLSRRQLITYGNGVNTDPEYNADSSLYTLTHGGGRSATYTFGRNFVNEITSKSVTAVPSGAWTEATLMGKPLNANNTAYAPDKLNRYTTVAVAAQGYDGNSNLTSDGTFTFGYDVENRLRTATGPGISVAYEYDPAGRRRAKTVNGSQKTIYLSDGVEEIEERDGTNALLRRYAYGASIDERVTMLDPTCSPRCYYQTNHQASTIAVTNQAGTLVDAYGYDPYGLSSAGPTGNQFRYTGRRFDPETGLYYYRARHYSPKLGRFLQTDPIGTADDLNLYAYVGNDPANAVDPTGTTCVGIVDPAITCWSADDSRWKPLAVPGPSRPSDNSGNRIGGVGSSGFGASMDDNHLERSEGYFHAAAVVASLLPIERAITFGRGLWAARAANNAARGAASAANVANKVNHIFRDGKNLQGLVRASGGSAEAAYGAVQNAANDALRRGLLTPGANGVLPGAGAGAVLNVNGVNVQLIGGRIIDGVVQLGSFVGL